jgi:hypothetical protein
VSFVYNEEARKEGCQSSIAPHTLKRLTLDSSRVHADSIHIEYTDATAQPPIVKATLDGKFDKRIGPKHIMGVLTVARIDQPAAIFNWKTQSAVNIDTVKR